MIFHEWCHCEVKAPDDVVLVLIRIDLSCLLIIEHCGFTLIKFELGLTWEIFAFRWIVRLIHEWFVSCQMSLSFLFIVKDSFTCNNSSIILPFMTVHLTFDERSNRSLLLSYELFLDIVRYWVLNWRPVLLTKVSSRHWLLLRSSPSVKGSYLWWSHMVQNIVCIKRFICSWLIVFRIVFHTKTEMLRRFSFSRR